MRAIFLIITGIPVIILIGAIVYAMMALGWIIVGLVISFVIITVIWDSIRSTRNKKGPS